MLRKVVMFGVKRCRDGLFSIFAKAILLLMWSQKSAKARSLGADYLWLKGLGLYAEVAAYSVANPYFQNSLLSVFKRNSVVPKNKGVVFIVGAKVSI
jgi:hypothetical protein